ncbi:MAG: High-affnity carbon uptake protein Hat/HatR [Cyclobacteriaceae bacterium]
MVNYPLQVGESEDEELTPFPLNEKLAPNPFPGLRPFSLDECHLFFGREGHADEILEKLAHNRVVTVLGYSGSGKSSLMYCGLIPMLYGGFMTQNSPLWKVVIARPGSSPIENLTDSIIAVLAADGRLDESDIQIHRAVISSVLRSGSNGLVEICNYIRTELNENVFFLIDQFEELFKYRESKVENADNESIEYVNLILNTVAQSHSSAYVALSMRADFLGNCAEFRGLTELVNSSNYLVPQMTREQKRLVIEGPVAVGGGRISKRLVKRLLSDIGDNQDQLPILQHALMRTWNYWLAYREPGEPMDLRHYNAIGQISQALSLHANEAYDELTTNERIVAETLFKAITEKSQESQGTRRPSKIGLIAELAEVSEGEVIAIVDKFRQPGRSFLMPSDQVELTTDSIIELSHESLMRIWNRLSGWVDEEYESARMYKRVSEAAAMYQIGKTSLWRPPDLQLALNWQKKQNPSRAWAQRYDIAFERAIVFLDTSRITFEAELKNQEMLQRRMLRRARITSIILGIAFLFSMGMFLYGLINNIQAQKDKEIAQQETKKAVAAREDAERSRKVAEEQTKEVLKKEEQLKKSYAQLESALIETRLAKDFAQAQYLEAKRQTNLAIESSIKEKAANEVAQAKTIVATQALEKADRLYYLTVAQSLEAKSEGIDDKELAGLTAMQGYLFHTEYNGPKYDPYVFRGLYYALTKLAGKNYNAVKVPGGLKNKMFALAVSQKTDKFFTTGNDGRIMRGSFVDLKTDAPFASNKGYANRVLALSKDEKYMVNGSDSSNVEIFDLEFPDRAPKKVKGHRASILDIKCLPDNSGFISISADRTMRLTNQVTGQSRNVLNLPFDLKSIDISPDGKWIIGGSTSWVLLLINTSDYTFKELLKEPSNRILSVAFNPARPNLIAFGSEVLGEAKKINKGTVKIIDLNTQKVKELSGHKAGVIDVEFSPDGKLLASAGLDRRLQMWLVDHEEDLPIVMDNNNGNVWHVAFASDTNFLVASCNEGEIRVYPTDIRMLADKVCPGLTRNMTKEEWRIYVGSDIKYQSTCRSLLIKDF